MAKLFIESEYRDDNIQLFMGDISSLPFDDNSIDLVYTMHALEPNGGREEILLKELYRVTRKWLVLLEPSYEIADDSQREWMEQHGYIQGLKRIILDNKMDLIKFEKFNTNERAINPAAVMVIKKLQKRTDNSVSCDGYCCPITKTRLKKIGNALYSEESFLSYPILNDIPLLTKEYAVVTTKMETEFEYYKRTTY